MRNPGTEPLPMISGDVMELHHLIYAEREAHAAEVARLRAAHVAMREAIMRAWSAQSIQEAHKALRPIIHDERFDRDYVATPSSAAVEAVENALKAAHDVLGDYDSSEEGRIGKRSAWALRAALAAYEEATRG